jgi:ABC-type multidrug transport system ATPase subunit
MTLLELAEHHNTTLIVVTHYPEESKFCTKIAIFGRKRGLIDFGPPPELINNLPGSGRAVDLILQIPTPGDPLPLLKQIPEIEFVLEEKRHAHYRMFTNLPVATIQSLAIEALGTESLTAKQSEATMVDYFRIKSLEVKA